MLYASLVGCSHSLPRDRRSLPELRAADVGSPLRSPFAVSLSINYFLTVFLLCFQTTFLSRFPAAPDVQTIGPLFVLQLSAFAVTSLLLPLLPEKHSKVVFLVPSNVLLAVGLSLLSPAPELGTQSVKVVIIVGLNLAGIASAVRVSVTQQELITHSYALYPGRYRDLATLLAGLRAFLEGLALLMGPLAALLMGRYLEFGHSIQILATLLFAGAFVDIWLLFGRLPPSNPPRIVRMQQALWAAPPPPQAPIQDVAEDEGDQPFQQ